MHLIDVDLVGWLEGRNRKKFGCKACESRLWRVVRIAAKTSARLDE
jgi:hypothetical protein